MSQPFEVYTPIDRFVIVFHADFARSGGTNTRNLCRHMESQIRSNYPDAGGVQAIERH
jgi:hypothetical protein